MVSQVVSEIVKVDDKGRVLIPDKIRKMGKIGPGTVLQIVDLRKDIFALRKLELPSREEILKTCRKVRREIYKKEVEPWLRKMLKGRK